MKIVVLSPHIYGESVGHGGGALSFGQLTRLAAKHEIHFISFVNEKTLDDNDDKCIADLRKICLSVTLVPLRVGRIKWNLSRIKHVFKLVPVYADAIDTKEMRKRLVNTLRVNPDVVFIQFPQMAQYVTSCNNIPTVLDVHDSYSVSAYRSYRIESTWFSKVSKLFNWLSWVSYEAKYYPLFTRVYTLTLQDSFGLRIYSPGLNVDVIPAAVDAPNDDGAKDCIVSNDIVFVGSAGHSPNIDAIRFFLEDIFPIVLNVVPEAEFCIVGKGHSALFGKYESKNVHFLGHVENMKDLYQSCQIVVVPVRIGGGIKIKTIEAMAHGKPIVSTSIGVEETGAQNGVHALIADSQKTFAEGIISLLKNQNARELLSRNAKKLAKQKFSWESRSDSLERLLLSAKERSSIQSDIIA